MSGETREQWLERAVEALAPLFKQNGYELPLVRVSVDRPARTKLGQCHARKNAADGLNHIFISSKLDDPVAVLETLAHELVHAVDDCKHGHRQPFPRICEAVGLEFQSASATPWSAAGREIAAHLASLLGPYPHARLEPCARPQTTRMLKATCPACGYVCRVARRWLEAQGPPRCPCQLEVMRLNNDAAELPPPIDNVALVHMALRRLNAEEWDRLRQDVGHRKPQSNGPLSETERGSEKRRLTIEDLSRMAREFGHSHPRGRGLLRARCPSATMTPPGGEPGGVSDLHGKAPCELRREATGHSNFQPGSV